MATQRRQHTAMSGENSPRPRVTRRAGRDKTEVLDAAAQVIGRRGAEATRFTDVAQASGVPISTLQYYFGSREDLLVAAFRHASETELAGLAADLDTIARPTARLTRIVDAVLDGYRPAAGQGPLWIEAWRFALRDQEMRADVRRDNLAWRHLVRDTVRAVLAERADPQPQDETRSATAAARAAVLIIALLDGLGLPLALDDPDIDHTEARAAALAAITRILDLPPDTLN
jgi:AcrR family transcriptional regulator